uniref:Im:7152348 n=1 Tax=Neogobius melanostomus TaxID=47308 RepID=A0A8C6TPD3_9GOBI
MVLCEDTECSVCLLPYTRLERIPRLLHCRHTFCQPCLETLSQSRGGLLTVCCPLCRRVTCVGRGLGLQGALWVDSRLWDHIVEDNEDEEESQDRLKRDGDVVRSAQAKRESSHFLGLHRHECVTVSQLQDLSEILL